MGTFIRAIVFLLFLTATFAESQSIGGDFLAAMHSSFKVGGPNCTQLLRLEAAQRKPFLQILWYSFGNDTSCASAFFASNEARKHEVEFYISNEVCRRNRDCEKREVAWNLTPSLYNRALETGNRSVRTQVKSRMAAILNFCHTSGNANTRCLLALGLESQFSHKALNALQTYAKETGWRSQDLVHNPVARSPYKDRGAIGFIEYHGLQQPKGFPAASPSHLIISLDGFQPRACGEATRYDTHPISNANMRRTLRKLKRTSDRIAIWCSVWQGISNTRTKLGRTSRLIDRRCDVPSKTIDGYLNVLDGIF